MVHGYHDGGWGPWHGHHGSTAERKLRSSKEDFWGFWGQTLCPHLILLPVFLLLSVSLAQFSKTTHTATEQFNGCDTHTLL